MNTSENYEVVLHFRRMLSPKQDDWLKSFKGIWKFEHFISEMFEEGPEAHITTVRLPRTSVSETSEYKSDNSVGAAETNEASEHDRTRTQETFDRRQKHDYVKHQRDFCRRPRVSKETPLRTGTCLYLQAMWFTGAQDRSVGERRGGASGSSGVFWLKMNRDVTILVWTWFHGPERENGGFYPWGARVPEAGLNLSRVLPELDLGTLLFWQGAFW